jgi:hypothetical protein
MARIFVLKENYGLAIAIANDAEGALDYIKKKSGCERLSHGKVPGDLTEIRPDNTWQGVFTYFCE